MNDIEKILETASIEEIEVPQKVQYKVRYTLKNKEKNKSQYLIKRLATTIASLIVVFLGSIGVYAVSGGTIAGKPIIEWLGVKFSDEYENYRVNIDKQELSNSEASIKLTSTVCDEGFTILEFDLKLNQENDIEKLEPIRVLFNNKLITNETGTYVESLNNYTIIIDEEEFWIRPRSAQTITQISESEYKIYQMYFLTDKELGNKKEFTITINEVVIEVNDIQNDEEEVYFQINGQFNVKVSKEKAVENTQIIEPECEEIKYKDMTKKVEKVMITPLQTIVKVSTLYENLSLQKLSKTEDKDYINLIEYEACNENEEELSVFSYETKRTITYSDGRVEEWEQGDIGTSEKFYNAKMELTEYVIIEKEKENSKIILTAKERLNEKKYNILGKFEINLKNK